MDSIADISGSVAALGPVASRPPGKIHEAAQQFEALLISQLFKTSREADGSGWLGTDEDDSGETGIEFGEEQMANALASSGGLRLSRLIETGLSAAQTRAAAE